MAHFAQLDDTNTVIRVIVVSNESCGEPTLSFPDTCPVGAAYIVDTLKLEGVWKQTSYHANFRARYAGIGMRYDEELDEFVEQEILSP